jgi:hypothetical protein
MHMRTAVARVGDHDSTGPSDVADQSKARARARISPPPSKGLPVLSVNSSRFVTDDMMLAAGNGRSSGKPTATIEN